MQMEIIIVMLILIILLSLLKTQNYLLSLLSLYQQKTIKNYQNFLAKDLKDQCIGMNIKLKKENKSTTNE